ncbi:Protein glp-1 [Orchesella cincta]|uniref:Protein glp-1 n=1 Tax=Orchesella cincta TaxID=48709 RepID=A0A1D2M834_ORCCI|nr:Protein glp-1 [Orchesella cincta]
MLSIFTVDVTDTLPLPPPWVQKLIAAKSGYTFPTTTTTTTTEPAPIIIYTAMMIQPPPAPPQVPIPPIQNPIYAHGWKSHKKG